MHKSMLSLVTLFEQKIGLEYKDTKVIKNVVQEEGDGIFDIYRAFIYEHFGSDNQTARFALAALDRISSGLKDNTTSTSLRGQFPKHAKINMDCSPGC